MQSKGGCDEWLLDAGSWYPYFFIIFTFAPNPTDLMRIIIMVLLATFCSHASFSQEHNKNVALHDLFNKIEQYQSSVVPQDSLYMGLHLKGQFGTTTNQAQKAARQEYKAFLEALQKFESTNLGLQDRISLSIMQLRLRDLLATIEFGMYRIPMNAEGGFYHPGRYNTRYFSFKNLEDYNAFLSWLPKYVRWLESQQALMEVGIKKGIVAAAPVTKNNLLLLKKWKINKAEDLPIYAPFQNFPATISEKDRALIKEKGTQIINNRLVPFYTNFIAFLEGPYLEAAPQLPGILSVPNGKAYYENRMRHYTTLDLGADSVHQLGLKEVLRIKKEMLTIIEEVNFEGDFSDFLTFLRTDPQFYAKTPQELLNHAAWMSKKAEAQLPKLFKKLYTLPFTVEPVPDAIAPTYTSGRYVPGSWHNQTPGIYWVNTYKLESRTLYTIPALTLHEAVPGHHLQGAVANELKGIPSFRNYYYISAFGEGWGLYSEYLGEEMGMYNTPYERFGRLTYEMWRACRLVVDTGIHFKGWTREKALNFMQSNTALSIHEVNTEIDRYIGWPGQAVSYKVGEIKIKSLRKKAEKALGDKFDVREFHFEVLKNGSVPLNILEEVIDAYIDKNN